MIDEKFYTRTSIANLAMLLENKSIQALVTSTAHLENKNLTQEIKAINVLKNAQQSELAFFDNHKYKTDFMQSHAGFCVINEKYFLEAPVTMIRIPSRDPYRLYALIAQLLYEDHTQIASLAQNFTQDPYGAMVHKNAVIEKDVKTSFGVVIHSGAHIGAGTNIGPNSFIGMGTHIGRGCIIESNVSITHSLIGDNVHILTGAKIGQDGFGFALGATHQPVPQLGRVIIQDSCSIGANTCVDRGTIKDTIIGEGSCIDNMVQIAHNVVLGLGCVIAGNSAIAGSVTFGDFVICGGHTCVAGHLNIGHGARISGGSALIRDVLPKQTVAGHPAFDIKSYFKSIATLKKLASPKE